MSSAGRHEVKPLEDGLPQASFADLGTALQLGYGLDLVEAQPTGGELHLNVRALTRQGTYLVKVGTPEGSIETWRDRILLHVQATSPELPVPRIVRSVAGNVSELWPADPDRNRKQVQIRVYEWLDGKILAKIRPTRDLLRQIGVTSAQLTQTLATFTDVSMDPHIWDLRTAPESIVENLAHVADEDNRSAVHRVLEMFGTVKPVLANLPVATVHHDLNDFNILVGTAPDRALTVAGILDFNDALQTYRVVDVAIAAAYSMLRQDRPLDAMGAVVAGYCSHIQLSEAELRAVFPFAALRLCLNATVWTSRTDGKDETSYAYQRMAATWPSIQILSRIDPERAREHMRGVWGLS